MAVVKIYSTNPTDRISTFDKTRFYEATDNVGTGKTLIETDDIDLTNSDLLNPGFTALIYTTGSLSKYYGASWYNSISGAETNPSSWVQGGQSRWDTQFMNEMKDTTSTIWSATDRETFKKATVEALYPDLYRQVIDTSLLIVNNDTNQTYQYTVPFGIFAISEIGVGNVDKTSIVDRDFKQLQSNDWKFEGNTIKLESLSGLTDGDKIRLVASKKYLDVGEVPERLDFLAMLYMRMSAFLQMADDYPRYKKWAQLQVGSKVSFAELRVHAREYERKFNEQKARVRDLTLASSQT